jgi:hypothetical protein
MQQAEAGFQDPELGWVGVRADSSGSGIHAQLVAGSADAAQALGSHIAGLNAYLTEHHTPVDSLTLSASASGWSGTGSNQSAGQETQQGTGQQSGQGSEAASTTGTSVESLSRTAVSSQQTTSAWLESGAIATAGEGMHISVMA